MWTGTRNDIRGLPTLKAASVPVFYSPAALARGIKSLHAYHAWRDRYLQRGSFKDGPGPEAPPLTPAQLELKTWLSSLERSALSEFESKRLMAAWGVRGTRETRANSADEAAAAAEELGFPVVLKADSADILHKTEAGVVRLGLGNASQVRTAYTEVIASASAIRPRRGARWRRGPGDGHGRRGSHRGRV